MKCKDCAFYVAKHSPNPEWDGWCYCMPIKQAVLKEHWCGQFQSKQMECPHRTDDGCDVIDFVEGEEAEQL